MLARYDLGGQVNLKQFIVPQVRLLQRMLPLRLTHAVAGAQANPEEVKKAEAALEVGPTCSRALAC